MAAEDEGLHFVATIDNKDFMRSLTEIRDAVVKTSQLLERVAENTSKARKTGTTAAQEAGKAIDKTDESLINLNKDVKESSEGFGKLAKAAAGFFTLQAAKSFAEKVFAVRQEVESLQTSFRILVGDKDKADALFQSIKEFAVSTPMQMKDLASAAQTMMGFGIPLEQIMQNLKAIGDVSMGDAQRFQGLALSFSQMSAAGKLMGQDLMQMINAGFNPLATISEKTGKSIGVLKDEMSKGAISADMVRQAFIDATSEGGKFHGMLEEQSKTLKGAYSNLQGAINDMFNSIGEKTDGVFKAAIDMSTTLAQNYEKVGTAIIGLIGTYGTYKTAVMTVTAVEKGWTVAEVLHYNLLIAQEKAQKLLNATMLKNPYVAAAVALGVLCTAVATYISGSKKAEQSTDDLNKAFADTQAELAAEQKKIDELFDKLRKAKKGTDDYKSAKDAIISQYGSYLSGLGAEVSSLNDVEGAYRAVAKAAREAAMARGMEAAMRKASEDYGTSYSENYDDLANELREAGVSAKEAGKLMGDLRKDLAETGKVSEQTKKKLASAVSKHTQKDISETGAEADILARRAVGRYIGQLELNEKTYQEVRKQAEEKFGVKDKNTPKSSDQKKWTNQDFEDEIKAKTQELESLSEKEAKGAKGAALKKAIVSLQERKSKAFSTTEGTKQAKAAAREAAKAERQRKAEERKALQQAIIAAEAEEKSTGIQAKQKEERERAARELELATREAQIKAMEEGTEKAIAQIELDYDREMEAIRRGNEEIRQKRIEEAKALWDADPKKKGTDFYKSQAYKDASDVSYTDIELKNMEALEALAEKTRAKALEKLAKHEAESMREYLKEYGDYQQQRQAISEEYDEKIRKAQTEGEKLMLGKQKESALRQVDERFGVVTQAMADLFADASKKSVKAIQAIIDKYEVLVKYMEGNKGTATQDELSKFGLSQDVIDRILRGEISIKELTDRLKELKGELADRSPYQSFVSNMTAIIKQLKEAKNAADVGTAITSMTDSISSFLPAVKEFSADMANIFGADDSKLQGVMDGLGGLATAGGGVGQIMSGDVVGGVMNTVKGISQMVDALDGLFGADYSSYERMVEEYGNLISVWDELIEKKKEYISESFGVEAANAGREAERLLANEMQAWRTLGRERTAAGASAGSHSIGYRVRERMNAEDWAGVQRAIGTTDLGGRLDKLYDLTSEQLQRLKEESPSFWAKLDGDMRNYLQNIIDGEDKLEEIQDKVKEQLTNTTFDSVKDSFLSALSDMDKSASDFSQDFTKYLFDAVMNAQVGEMLDKELRGWYDDFSRYMESGAGELTDAEMEALRTTWDGIVRKGVEMRDAISAATGYTGSSSEGSATYNAAKSFTQEQGDILNGRLTAIQIHTAEGNAIGRQIAASLQSMAAVAGSTAEANTAVLEIRNMMIYTNSHLEDLVRYAKATYNDFGMKLDNVINNLNTKL